MQSFVQVPDKTERIVYAAAMNSCFEIDISNSQRSLKVDMAELRRTLQIALQMEQVASAVLSISIVDNATIHRLNREHLQHDYPTDVISFPLEISSPDEYEDEDEDQDADVDEASSDETQNAVDVSRESALGELPEPEFTDDALRAAGCAIEGEIIASAEMARELAAAGRWTPLAELKLYLVHGMLHICGYDDQSPEEQQKMRARERAIMSQLGLTVVYPGESHAADLSQQQQQQQQQSRSTNGSCGRTDA